MAYCPRCGTENDPSATHCPLCATPLPRLDDLPGEPAWPLPGQGDPARVWATPAQKRRLAFGLVSALLLFPALVVTGVDLLVGGHVTWSWIPDVILVGVFSLVCAGFALYRRPLAFLTVGLGLLGALMLGVDALDSPGLDWSPRLGVPLALWTWTLLVAGRAWLRRHPHPGWSLFGNVSLGLALYCAGIEALIRVFAGGEGLWWSAVVALVLVPFGGLFHALHSVLGKRLSLRQTFHW